MDFGGASSAIVPGVAYGLIERSSSNLHLLGDATCSEIRFDKANRELLLTLAGEDKNYRIDFVDEAVTLFDRVAGWGVLSSFCPELDTRRLFTPSTDVEEGRGNPPESGSLEGIGEEFRWSTAFF